MDRLTVYEKPACRELLAKAGISARDVLRVKEPLVADLERVLELLNP
jgi:hypothetical protein